MLFLVAYYMPSDNKRCFDGWDQQSHIFSVSVCCNKNPSQAVKKCFAFNIYVTEFFPYQWCLHFVFNYCLKLAYPKPIYFTSNLLLYAILWTFLLYFSTDIFQNQPIEIIVFLGLGVLMCILMLVIFTEAAAFVYRYYSNPTQKVRIIILLSLNPVSSKTIFLQEMFCYIYSKTAAFMYKCHSKSRQKVRITILLSLKPCQ